MNPRNPRFLVIPLVATIKLLKVYQTIKVVGQRQLKQDLSARQTQTTANTTHLLAKDAAIAATNKNPLS